MGGPTRIYTTRLAGGYVGDLAATTTLWLAWWSSSWPLAIASLPLAITWMVFISYPIWARMLNISSLIALWFCSIWSTSDFCLLQVLYWCWEVSLPFMDGKMSSGRFLVLFYVMQNDACFDFFFFFGKAHSYRVNYCEKQLDNWHYNKK